MSLAKRALMMRQRGHFFEGQAIKQIIGLKIVFWIPRSCLSNWLYRQLVLATSWFQLPNESNQEAQILVVVYGSKC